LGRPQVIDDPIVIARDEGDEVELLASKADIDIGKKDGSGQIRVRQTGRLSPVMTLQAFFKWAMWRAV